jgi:hypothetical protein
MQLMVYEVLSIVVPNVEPIYDVLQVRPIFTAEWIPFMADYKFLPAVATTMISIRDNIRGSSNFAAPSRAALRSHAQALSTVNGCLFAQEKLDDALVMAVLFLAVLEVRGRLV